MIFPSETDWKCTNLILVRHAESTNNCLFDKIKEEHKGKEIDEETLDREECQRREADCGLSEKGLLQAKKLGNFFNYNFQRESRSSIVKDVLEYKDNWGLYSSPMKRCLMTCQQISIGLNNKKVSVIPNVYESSGCYKYTIKGQIETSKGYSGVIL